MLPAWRKWPRSARKPSVLPRRAVMAHTIPMNDALSADPAPLTARECKDLKVLALFTAVYCREHHPGPRRPLSLDARSLGVLPPDKYPVCPVCAEFLIYAFDRRIRCPLVDKPSCKHCQIHCFRPGHRETVREIMRFSGRYLLRRGRLDLLWHYLF